MSMGLSRSFLAGVMLGYPLEGPTLYDWLLKPPCFLMLVMFAIFTGSVLAGVLWADKWHGREPHLLIKVERGPPLMNYA